MSPSIRIEKMIEYPIEQDRKVINKPVFMRKVALKTKESEVEDVAHKAIFPRNR